MTIRLTSVESFNKVLEELKQDSMYSEEANAIFFKYCVPDIRQGVEAGGDEWYLDVDWLPDRSSYKVVMVIRYHKRSEIQTDVEYLTDKQTDK